MLGYAELLQEGIYGAPPEKFLPILTRIRFNGEHLLGLINTVLICATGSCHATVLVQP